MTYHIALGLDGIWVAITCSYEECRIEPYYATPEEAERAALIANEDVAYERGG